MAEGNVKDWVCTALEMEEKGQELFSKALAGCPEAIGKDVFKMLVDDGQEHKKRISNIYESMQQGGEWELVCRLPEERVQDTKSVLHKLVDQFSNETQACFDTMQALQMGIDFELSLVKFYEEALQKADKKEEKRFLHRMVQEKRGHYMLLSDLNYYYEDPEGWAYMEDDPILDGA